MKEEKLCIEDTKLDQKLLDGGVRFLPWIGKDYDKGLSYDNDGKLILGTEKNPGKKILVLGESHYIDDEYNSGYKSFTRGVIKDFLLREENLRLMNTFIKFERSLCNRHLNMDESKELWTHMAFYNYMTVPQTSPRTEVQYEKYADSEKAFKNVLEFDSISPDYIIVWGMRLYSYMPLLEGGPGETISYGDYDSPTWVYKTSKKSIFVLPIYHPSVGYDWAFWYQIIRIFINGDYGS